MTSVPDGRAPAPALRVLMVTPRYFPAAGGIQTHIREVSERLMARGVEVTLLTTDPTGALRSLETIGGLVVHRVRSWPANRDYYFAPALDRVIREGAWNLVHCQGVHTFVAPMAMIAARRARLPYLVTFHTGGHSTGLRHRLRGLQWRAIGPLLTRACRLVAVSQFEGQLFQALVQPRPGRLVVIPNGVTPLPPVAPRPRSDGPVITSIGRLERYKGHHRLIEALPHLLARRPGARAVILGTGPYETDLRELADRLGVADRVEIGSVPAGDRSAMAERLAAADLVVLLSEYEAHPVALLEAASAGRPVLVARNSGLNELVDAGLAHGTSIDAPARRTADDILSALQDPGVTHGHALPSWEQATDALLAEYRACLPDPR